MNRPMALALILLLPNFVNADMALLPQRRGLPVQVTITIERDYPDYEFFVAHEKKVERVSLTTSNPLILSSEERGGHVFGVYVYAIPKADLVALNGGETPANDWLVRDENRKYFAGSFYERSRVDFTDNRERIEKTFVLRVLPESCRLELVSENHGNRWVERGWAGLCCVLPPVAIILFGWLVRKLTRNRTT